MSKYDVKSLKDNKNDVKTIPVEEVQQKLHIGNQGYHDKSLIN